MSRLVVWQYSLVYDEHTLIGVRIFFGIFFSRFVFFLVVGTVSSLFPCVPLFFLRFSLVFLHFPHFLLVFHYFSLVFHHFPHIFFPSSIRKQEGGIGEIVNGFFYVFLQFLYGVHSFFTGFHSLFQSFH